MNLLCQRVLRLKVDRKQNFACIGQEIRAKCINSEFCIFSSNNNTAISNFKKLLFHNKIFVLDYTNDCTSNL